MGDAMTDKTILSVPELSERLKIPAPTIHQWIARYPDEFPREVRQVGTMRLYSLTKVRRFMATKWPKKYGKGAA
jgi:predicted DNA-binding transcriptional regulator AlpA